MSRDEDWVDPADKIDESQKRYATSEKGKEARTRYRQSNRGKQAQDKYLHSDKGKNAHQKYRNSDKGRDAQERSKEVRNSNSDKLDTLRKLIETRTELGLCLNCGKDHEGECKTVLDA